MAKRGPKPDKATGPHEPEKKPETDGASASTGAAVAAAPGAQQPEADQQTEHVSEAADKAADKAPPSTPSEAKPKTVVVTGPAKGRWRIGRHFTAEPVSIDEADLTAEQIEALQADPALTVEIVDAPY